jgi:hypothetical protein
VVRPGPRASVHARKRNPRHARNKRRLFSSLGSIRLGRFCLRLVPAFVAQALDRLPSLAALDLELGPAAFPFLKDVQWLGVEAKDAMRSSWVLLSCGGAAVCMIVTADDKGALAPQSSARLELTRV